MLFTALVIVAVAAALALASRGGARRASAFTTVSALAATAGITVEASRAPLVRNLTDLPGATTLLVWLLAIGAVAASIVALARTRDAAGAEDARHTALVSGGVALAAGLVLAVGVFRSRARLDEWQLRPPACATGAFGDGGVSAGYGIHVDEPNDVKNPTCTLVVTTPSGERHPVPLYAGASYGGTPECGAATVVLCGDARLLFVSDQQDEAFALAMFFAENRYRGFRLPSMDPFDPTTLGTRAILAPPRPLLVLAALAVVVGGLGALASRRGRSRRLALVAGVLVTPLLALLVAEAALR